MIGVVDAAADAAGFATGTMGSAAGAAGGKRTGAGSAGRAGSLIAALALAMVLALGFAPEALAESQAYDSDIVGSTEVGSLSSERDVPSVDATTGILATSDGKVLWSRDSDLEVPMASTTKIMTALLALELGSLDDQIEVSENAAAQEGSTAYLVEGDVIEMEDMLYALMLPSGNDAAMAIAEYYGDGDVDVFIGYMNAKAEDLGMVNTHFSSPSGLEDEDNYTTASDYLNLVIEAMGNETFRTVVSTTSYSFTSVDGSSGYSCENTNEMLGEYDGILGIKTGYTDAAGYCLVAAAERDGVELYSIVFGSSSATSRFTDTEGLLDWGFEHYHYVTFASTDVVVGQAVATSWIDKTVSVVASEDVSYLVFDYDEDFDQYVTIDDKAGAIEAGAEMGSITWSRDGVEFATVTLVAADSVEAPNLLETMQIWWYRFTALFTGDDISVEQEIYLDDSFSILDDAITTTDSASE